MVEESEIWGDDQLKEKLEEISPEISEESVVSGDVQEGKDFISLFFPSEDSIAVTLYAYIFRVLEKPKICAIRSVPSPALVEGGMDEYQIRSSWTIPTASEMDEYRAEASEYRVQDNSYMVNNLLLRDIIVSAHLKALLLPPDYKPFPLNSARRNRLSQETMKRLKKLHSEVYDKLYVEFQSEACLSI